MDGPVCVRMDAFRPVHTVIELPTGSIWLRGYATNHPALSNRPAYFTTRFTVAKPYADRDGYTVGLFQAKRPLRVYDLRYLVHLLSDIIDQRQSNEARVSNLIKTWSLAFGMCSRQRQIALIRERFPTQDLNARIESMQRSLTVRRKNDNPIELQGVRIAETANDIEAMIGLQVLFPNIDGFIAPQLYSPYHTEKTDCLMNSELVLFRPEDCLALRDPSLPTLNVRPVDVFDLLNGLTCFVAPEPFEACAVWMRGGGGDKDAPLEDRNDATLWPNYKRTEAKVMRAVHALRFGRKKEINTFSNAMSIPSVVYNPMTGDYTDPTSVRPWKTEDYGDA